MKDKTKAVARFEENLRKLAYDSYSILEETEPNTKERVQWVYIDNVLDSLVGKFFDGYGVPYSD